MGFTPLVSIWRAELTSFWIGHASMMRITRFRKSFIISAKCVSCHENRFMYLQALTCSQTPQPDASSRQSAAHTKTLQKHAPACRDCRLMHRTYIEQTICCRRNRLSLRCLIMTSIIPHRSTFGFGRSVRNTMIDIMQV